MCASFNINVKEERPFVREAITFKVIPEYYYIDQPTNTVGVRNFFERDGNGPIPSSQKGDFVFDSSLSFSTASSESDTVVSGFNFFDTIPLNVEYFKFRLLSAGIIRSDIIIAGTPPPPPPPVDFIEYNPEATFDITLNQRYYFPIYRDTIENRDLRNQVTNELESIDNTIVRTRPSEWIYLTSGNYNISNWKFMLSISIPQAPNSPPIPSTDYFLRNRISAIRFSIEFEYRRAPYVITDFEGIENQELNMVNLYQMMRFFLVKKKSKKLKTENIDGVSDDLIDELKKHKNKHGGKYLPEPYTPEEITKFTKYILDTMASK